MPLPTLGVVIVTFNSRDDILDCLESLLAATGVVLEIVIVDNGSTDDTLGVVRDWAAGQVAYTPPGDLPFELVPSAKPQRLSPEIDPEATPTQHRITVIETGINSGYAGGVNRGLALLARCPWIDRFWVLNPDSAVPQDTPKAFATEPEPPGGFALMGGRVVYLENPDQIQIDGGLINRRTGVTGNVGLGQSHAATPPPAVEDMDFITGASFVASRAFYETVGPMQEDYFLYYEEVDWALRRGDMPLHYCSGGLVYHRAGTAIGSPTLGRAASSFSLYFKHRARLRFVWRFLPWSLLGAVAYSVAKAGQLALSGDRSGAVTILRATSGLGPSQDVRSRLSEAAAQKAFGGR